MRPHRAGSELLELAIVRDPAERVANVTRRHTTTGLQRTGGGRLWSCWSAQAP